MPTTVKDEKYPPNSTVYTVMVMVMASRTDKDGNVVEVDITDEATVPGPDTYTDYEEAVTMYRTVLESIP